MGGYRLEYVALLTKRVFIPNIARLRSHPCSRDTTLYPEPSLSNPTTTRLVSSVALASVLLSHTGRQWIVSFLSLSTSASGA